MQACVASLSVAIWHTAIVAVNWRTMNGFGHLIVCRCAQFAGLSFGDLSVIVSGGMVYLFEWGTFLGSSAVLSLIVSPCWSELVTL